MRISQIVQFSGAAVDADHPLYSVFHVYQDVAPTDFLIDPQILSVEQKGRRRVDMFNVFQELQSRCLEINAIDTTSPQFQLQFKGLPETMIHLFLRHHIDFNQIECHKGRCTCIRAYGTHFCADAFLDCLLSAAHKTWSIFSENQRQEILRAIKSSLWQAVIASRLHIDNRITRQQMTSDLQPFLSTGASATPAVLAVLQDYFTLNIIIFDTVTGDFGVVRSKHFRHFRPYLLFIQHAGSLTLVRRTDANFWTWSAHSKMLREIVTVSEITATGVDIKALPTPLLSDLAHCLGNKNESTRAELDFFLSRHQFTKGDFELIKPILSGISKTHQV